MNNNYLSLSGGTGNNNSTNSTNSFGTIAVIFMILLCIASICLFSYYYLYNPVDPITNQPKPKNTSILYGAIGTLGGFFVVLFVYFISLSYANKKPPPQPEDPMSGYI